MIIWLDADGCPNDVKDCVFKASQRTNTKVTLVADRSFRIPPSNLLELIVVNKGQDAADDYIVEHAASNDLVVTDDIPLAHRCVGKNITTMNRRGLEFDERNIGERIATRDLLESLRGAGMFTGGPPPYSQLDKKKFAETFDRLLHKLLMNERRKNQDLTPKS